jgi:hypothetical protein
VTTQQQETTWIHTAIFVDFDNIFLSLKDQDETIADYFASNPDQWLAWLEQSLPVNYVDGVGEKRRVLCRRCYLNPQSFSNYRPYFIRNAFEVIDCPPLTTRGKTSTDIHMVMDILDALNHPTRLNEFIILSGDADFTPVLLRLRRHARWSVVLSAGYVSPAYKASADYLINQEVFIQEALGFTDPDEESEAELPVDAIDETIIPLLNSMAERLYAEAENPDGIEASNLVAIYKEFDEFQQGSNWLGLRSLRRLTQAIVSRRDDLMIVEDDPWRVTRVLLEEEPDLFQPSVLDQTVSEADGAYEEERAQIGQLIQAYVKESEKPVTMSVLAARVLHQFDNKQAIETGWFGAGAFANLLDQVELGDLKISNKPPGYVYDPSRHEDPILVKDTPPSTSISKPADLFAATHPNLEPLARKVKQLTDTPYLMPEHYAVMLREIARAINEKGYHITRTSKIVRDRCVEKGAPVSRSAVNFVLRGIKYAGYRYGKGASEDPQQLGEALVENIVNLCEAAQFIPSEEEIEQINYWILDGLSED